MSTIAIIQARMSSTRLPGKVLKDLIPGVTALEYMLTRISHATLLDKIILATTENSSDVVIVEKMKGIGQSYFVGSENDVLDRYYKAAVGAGAQQGDIIVRLTSDCPLHDPAVIDEVVRYFKSGDFDYAENALEPYTYPDGMDTEVFTFDALERAWKEATMPSHREHVTFYFWTNPKLFKLGHHVNPKTDQAGYRLTLDYPSDYELIRKVAQHFAPRMDFTMDEILVFLDANPDIKALNKDVVQNAAYKTA
ncbi:MAG: glycosyltransferase family protein [bacterium]|nr:glycosyltransferase family protein [bacterium]